MKTLDILIKARAVISDESRWIKGRLYASRLFEWSSAMATVEKPTLTCAACALGATRVAVLELNPTILERSDYAYAENYASAPLREAERFLAASINPRQDRSIDRVIETITKYNDAPTTTHAEIVGIFDRAIHLAAQ